MPAKGSVSIEVSPWQAVTIAGWLETVERNAQITPLGILSEAIWKFRDQHDVSSLADKFRKLSNRKRPGGPFKLVEVQISRKDAAWIAEKVRRRGMFGRRLVQYLPSAVQSLGDQCANALANKRGRKRLVSGKLAAAVQREHLDERHRKRLRRRHREELALKKMTANYAGILAKALMDSSKSS